MVSVGAGGSEERMAARDFCRVLWAGSGPAGRYSSMDFGEAVGFGLAGELRLPDFGLFMRERLQERVITVYGSGRRPEISAAVRGVRRQVRDYRREKRKGKTRTLKGTGCGSQFCLSVSGVRHSPPSCGGCF